MKTNWEAIKTDYISGSLSLADEAEKFKVNYDVLRRHASRENWAELRKQFTAKVENLAREEKSIVMAEESVKFDAECLKVARAGIEAIQKAMRGKRKSLPGLSVATANFQKVGKLAFGESTETPGKVEIDAKDKLISAIDRVAARIGAVKDSPEIKPS